MIQTYLLDLLSLGLTRKPYREHLPTATAHSLAQAIQLGRASPFLPLLMTARSSVVSSELTTLVCRGTAGASPDSSSPSDPRHL